MNGLFVPVILFLSDSCWYLSLFFLCLFVTCLCPSTLSVSLCPHLWVVQLEGHLPDTQVLFCLHHQALLTPHTGPWFIQVLDEHLLN